MKRIWTAAVLVVLLAGAGAFAAGADGGEERSLAVQPLGEIDRSMVERLVASLCTVFEAGVEILPGRPLPPEAFYPPRSRYRADKLLDSLASSKPIDCDRVLGLTSADISVTKGPYPDWGVFGYAWLSGQACVVSIHRLKRTPSAEHPLSERLFKVAVHEIGHTLGLPHCPTPKCVMRDCLGSIATVDSSKPSFCARCRARIGGWLKSRP
jgi:archaemetzincin